MIKVDKKTDIKGIFIFHINQKKINVITIFNVEKWTDDWYILSYTDDSYIKPMIKFNYGNYGNNPRYKYFVLDRIEDIITIIRDSI